MVHPLLRGLPLLRYSRAGAWLRIRRSCWLGLPAPFKLSGGRGALWELSWEPLGTLWGFSSEGCG
eukprot:3447751-Pyramimonas_sp.AAC.1